MTTIAPDAPIREAMRPRSGRRYRHRPHPRRRHERRAIARQHRARGATMDTIDQPTYDARIADFDKVAQEVMSYAEIVDMARTERGEWVAHKVGDSPGADGYVVMTFNHNGHEIRFGPDFEDPDEFGIYVFSADAMGNPFECGSIPWSRVTSYAVVQMIEGAYKAANR